MVKKILDAFAVAFLILIFLGKEAVIAAIASRLDLGFPASIAITVVECLLAVDVVTATLEYLVQVEFREILAEKLKRFLKGDGS